MYPKIQPCIKINFSHTYQLNTVADRIVREASWYFESPSCEEEERNMLVSHARQIICALERNDKIWNIEKYLRKIRCRCCLCFFFSRLAYLTLSLSRSFSPLTRKEFAKKRKIRHAQSFDKLLMIMAFINSIYWW